MESTFTQESTLRAGEERRLPALTLAWHPELERIGERVLLFGLVGGRGVDISRLSPDFAHVNGNPYPLADRSLSRRPIRLAPGRAADTFSLSTEGSKTSLAVDGTEVDGEIELGADHLHRGVVLTLSGRIVLILHWVLDALPASPLDLGLVGNSCAMRQVRRDIERVAQLEIPILLRGATGTGKELVAHAIHRQSRRADHPFLALNMAAIPPSLAAAELFGAAKGAYTGAAQATPGYFRRAQGGTLLLDEIGEMPVEVQALLLRALESGEIQSIGGLPTKSDVRLIAATDADLESEMESGRFRAPLLHRLGGYVIQLPTLAQRREDIGPLLIHFLRHELKAIGRDQRLQSSSSPGEPPWLAAPLVARLARHPWPGNVRELRNLARRLAVGWSDRAEVPSSALEEILGAHPPTDAGSPTATEPKADPHVSPSGPKRKAPSEITDDELLAALRANRFQTRATARALGISRTSLYAMIERSSSIRKAADLEVEDIESALAQSGGRLAEAAAELEVSALGLKRRCKELGLDVT